MSCIYDNVFINNCSQLYQFVKDSSNYELKLYYKINRKYILQPSNTKYINMDKNTTDNLIRYIKLYKSLPTNI